MSGQGTALRVQFTLSKNGLAAIIRKSSKVIVSLYLLVGTGFSTNASRMPAGEISYKLWIDL